MLVKLPVNLESVLHITDILKNHFSEKIFKNTAGKISACMLYSQEELWARERYWIKTLNSKVPFGYNISSGESLNRKVRVKEEFDKRTYDEKNIEVCVLSHVMNIISSKWKLRIILFLTENGTTRFNELKRRVTGITQFMLTKSLKELESDGLINRKVLKQDPPQIVEYSLTPLALELLPALNELYTWGSKHLGK